MSFTTTTDEIAAIAAGIAFISLLISGLALWVTITNERKNRELTKNLADKDQELTKQIADKDQELTKQIADKDIELTKKMFQRQGIFELHKVWDEVASINIEKPIFEDVRKLVNALNLTASIWHHDIIIKELILSYYWRTFRHLYNELNSCNVVLPEYKKQCNELISDEVTKAYKEMEDISLEKKVAKTTLN